MIHGFSIPYPDELFCSLVARRDKQMGYPSYMGVLREVFGCTSMVVAFEFPSRLGQLTAALPPSHPCADFKRLEQLTLLPWYAYCGFRHNTQSRLAAHLRCGIPSTYSVYPQPAACSSGASKAKRGASQPNTSRNASFTKVSDNFSPKRSDVSPLRPMNFSEGVFSMNPVTIT